MILIIVPIISRSVIVILFVRVMINGITIIFTVVLVTPIIVTSRVVIKVTTLIINLVVYSIGLTITIITIFFIVTTTFSRSNLEAFVQKSSHINVHSKFQNSFFQNS
ncbi:hypothetical protein ACS45_07630 [Bacillus cereus]|nr:hypothetical protein ACS45_07630 [Bacillus cereus]